MRANRAGMGVTLALHALVVLGLLNYAPARQVLLAVAPIMVDLITPRRLEVNRLEPPTEFPKAMPVSKAAPLPLAPAPVLSVPAEAPSPATAPRAQASQPVATAEPAAIMPPVFNADYLENPAPAYPALSRRLGEQGKVMLRVLVNASGTAADVQVRNSSGHARLDEAARDTVRRWRFVPAKRGPEPVAAWVLIPISFRLEG